LTKEQCGSSIRVFLDKNVPGNYITAENVAKQKRDICNVLFLNFDQIS
jgi:hypothetical protein